MSRLRLRQSEVAESLSAVLRPFGPRFAGVTVYFSILFVVGTIGYLSLEGWGLVDAAYMAVLTLTAIGYGEVHPLSPAGRLFTIPIMILSIVGLGILWALITALVVELDLGGMMRRRRAMRRIEELRDHYLVCGGGRMGRVVMRELIASGRPFVVIEADAQRAAALLGEFPDLLLVHGDATREQLLTTAGLGVAKELAACLPGDADNLFLCLTARGLRPNLEIVSRASDEESLDKLRRAGANHVVSPEVTGAVRMASTLLRPSVVSFLDAVTFGGDITLRLEETVIPAGSNLAGRTLAEARIPQRTGLIVLALRRAVGGAPTYNPGPESRLEVGDVMIALGDPGQMQRLRDYVAGATPQPCDTRRGAKQGCAIRDSGPGAGASSSLR